MSIRLLLCLFLLGSTCVAGAQPIMVARRDAPPQRQEQQLTAQQRAAIQKQNEVLVRYAVHLVQMIDRGQIGQVWDGASILAKKAVSRSRFIRNTKADRTRLGNVTSRRLARITRTRSNGQGSLPAGYYVNVSFATKFSRYRKPVRELLSLHLDRDNKWRMCGYTLH